MKSALDILLAATEFDAVVAVPGSSARFHPDHAVKPIIDAAGGDKPSLAVATSLAASSSRRHRMRCACCAAAA